MNIWLIPFAEWWVNVEGPSPSLEQGDKKCPGRYRMLSLVFPDCITIRSRRKVWRRLRRTVSPICRWIEGKAPMLYLLFTCQKSRHITHLKDIFLIAGFPFRRKSPEIANVQLRAFCLFDSLRNVRYDDDSMDCIKMLPILHRLA